MVFEIFKKFMPSALFTSVALWYTYPINNQERTNEMNLRQQLKFTARGFLTTAKPSPLLVGLAAVALLQVLELMERSVTNYSERYNAIMAAYQDFMDTGNFDQLLGAAGAADLSIIQVLLSTLLVLMSLMVSVGIVIYAICAIRYRKGTFGNLLDGMPILLRVVWYQMLTSIYTFLWSLLFVVPGIMASYSYRMGLYILLDHPEMSVNQCIKASKQMMNGNRWELFIIDLSFFGWNMGVSMITSGASLSGMGYAGLLLALPLSAFVTMYMQFTDFLYFEHLHGVHYDTSIPAADPTQS